MNFGFLSAALTLAIASVAGAASNARLELSGSQQGSRSPQELEAAVRKGDKEAALELGIRYEEGVGVPRDERKAISLYRRAARTEVRRTSVYSPPVGSERYGRAVEAGQPQITPGIPEAADRLRRLQGRARLKQ